MGAGAFGAAGVDRQRVVGNLETFGQRHGLLAFFDFGVVELLDPAAVQADQVIVVLPLVDFVDGLARLEVAAIEEPGLLELGQDAVDRGQANVRSLLQQHAEHILGRHVPLLAGLKNLQDLQSRQGGFQACAFEFVDMVHGLFAIPASGFEKRRLAKPCRYNCANHIFPEPDMSVCPSKASLIALALVAGISAAGCSSGPSLLSSPAQWLTPYRPDVVQGNFISAEQVGQLKPGLSRLQVRNLLGTPLVSSLFHADRWDYVFSLKRGGDKQPSLYRYSVFFQGEALVKFEGDAMPSESEFVGQLGEQRQRKPAPSLQATPEQLEAARAAAARAVEREPAVAPAPAAAPSTYPALEGDRP